MDWPLALARPVSPSMVSALDAAGTWAPRVVASVRLVKGADASRVLVTGYDAARDPVVFPRAGWHLAGAWPEAPAGVEGGGLVVGAGLAGTLRLAVGDRVVLEGRTREGALNALPFVVRGVVATDHAGLDNTTAWVRMEDAEALLRTDGAVTHVALDVPGDEAAPGSVTVPGWNARTTREEVAETLALNEIRKKSLVLFVGVVMAIAATGIANTVVMSVFERVREIGTLLSLGMRRAEVRALFLLEGGAMGLAAGALGAALGTCLVLYFSRDGIQLGGTLTRVGGNAPISAVLYTRFTWPPLLGSLGFGFAASLLAAVWPASHAARLHPADATRADG
jgi:putative ABC transport system permease protein